MSGQPPLANGGMSPEGTTTTVRVNQPQIDRLDKKILCSALCKCDKGPSIGKNGQQLKQVCVSMNVKALDELLSHRSPYKQEVNYDMTKRPPAPIMDSSIATKAHDYLPGWIRKYWQTEAEHGPAFKAGKGLIRRPDVVIVKDPLRPPTQDNIKQIVEIKFPPDSLSAAQRAAYAEIAGGQDKLVELGPDQCDCDSPEPHPPQIPVKELSFAAAAAGWLAFILTRGKIRPPAPNF
jgi:hypothetical protein